MDTVKLDQPMPDGNKCPQCGASLPANAPAGLCPACLLKQGATADTVADAKQPPFQPPAVADLAAKFPQLEILELIGKGGMGAVYRARQKELDRIIALKILPPGIGDDPAFAERFAREAKALAKLNHPGIVTVYDFGRADGLFYFLMEFVDGVNLRQLLHAGRVSPREALAIVPQICDALQYAHDQGIVHRDIKPENILLDRRGRVKVADFGLAKLVGNKGRAELPLVQDAQQRVLTNDLTAAGKVMGTPSYMAPEQKEHPSEVDHRADIYALGVVFYQMLTGELPGKKIEPPSSKVHIDVRLDEIVLRALENKPELRYQQASVLKTHVETVAGNDSGVMGNQKFGAAARFSPTAILGALLIPVFFFSTAFWNFGHLGGTEALVGVVISTLGFVSIVTATILGWVAVAQIRRSGGRLCGMWLALLDGLALPGLVLNVLLLLGLLVVNQFINGWLLVWWYPFMAEHAFLNLPHILIWLLFAIAVIIGSNYMIVRGIWRALNKSANASAEAARVNWKTPLAVVGIIVAALVIAALVVHHFHPERPYYIGLKSFPQGDYIEITSVKRSTDQMVVKGFYSLVSHDQATLALYITTTNSIALPTDSKQELHISKGRGEFELIDSHFVPGLPHVSMYADGKPFASLYFGTRAEALEESKASWITNVPSVSAMTKTLTFGPVIERTIEARQTGTDMFLDLDTGHLLTPPREIADSLDWSRSDTERAWETLDIPEDSRRFRYLQWLRESGADLMFAGDGNVIGFDCTFPIAHGSNLTNWEGWTGLTPGDVRNAVAMVEWGREAREAERRHQPWPKAPVRGGIAPSAMQMDSSSSGGPLVKLLTCKQSAMWFFKTREGGLGILQIIGFTDNPFGVKIRYKLVQNDSPK